MRIAVLAMAVPLANDALVTCGGLRVGGDSIVGQQLRLAIAAGAARLLVLADRQTVGLEELIADARAAGLGTAIIADAPGLCAEVTAADELLVIGDALLADPVLALPLLAKGGVVTLPVEPGLAAGFERIDAESAWGGMMVIPGALAERLRQLPRDCDIASSLLRIALMAGVSVRPVDGAAIADKRWVVVRGEAEAQAVEEQRLRLSLAEARGRTPGRALAGFLVGRFGSRLFAAEKSPALVWWGALAPVLAAMGLAWFGLFGGAFFALALAWLAVRAAMILDNAERQGRIASALPDRRPVLALLGIDAVFAGVLALALQAPDGGAAPVLVAVCLAVVFTGLARIGAAGFPMFPARPFFEDRFTHAIVLQLAFIAGWLAAVVMATIIAVMLAWTARTTLGRPGDAG